MANSATVGILRVLLSANTAEFDAAMKKAASSADALTKNFNSIAQQATNVGSTLTKALTLPILGLGVASAKAAIDFESSFAGIRKTVDGVVDSAGNLTAAGKEMQQAMRDLAKEIPVNVVELNKLGETAGALGIPRDKVVEFTKVMAELGVTTNLTADEAADSIARIQNIFGAAGKDTDRLASTLVALGNAGASTEKEIVEMSQRIAGAGHTVGLTQAQVLGFASTLASVGINAEAGGSAISRVFLKINDAVAKGGKDMAEFARVANMSAADFKKSFETDAAGATTAFIEGLARLKASGENVNGTIEGLIGKNIILKDTLLRVSGAGSLLKDQLSLANKAWQDNTALTKEAEQRFKTTEQQMVLLWNRIKDVGITLGNALLPAIQSTIRAVDVFLPMIAGLAEAFGKLPGSAQAVVIGIGLIVAGIGPALLVFGQLAKATAEITALFGKKGIATRLLAGDLVTLEGASTKTATALGLLGKAASVASAAFVGWEIGRLIADLTGLDKKISDSITGLNNLTKARDLTAQGKPAEAQAAVTAKLTELEKARTDALMRLNFVQAALLDNQIAALKNDQTRLAIQDSINLAIKRGADAHINYAAAVKFNEEWTKKAADSQAWWNKQQEQGTAVTQTAAKSLSVLAQLSATYAEDLKKIGASGFKEIQKAHDDFGVSIEKLAKEYGVAETSIKKFIDASKDSAKASKENTKELKESVSFLFEFNKGTKELVDSMAKMDAASDKAFKNLTEKAMEGLNDDARQMVDKWKKIGEESGQKLAEGLAKSNKKFLADAANLQKGLIGLETDSLSKRQELIRLDYDEKRRTLNKYDSLYQQNLDLLNAEEAKALTDSEKQWKESQQKKAQQALDSLAQAFSQLAQISGGSFGGILKDIGEMIALLSLADKAGEALADSFGALGKAFGTIGKGPMSEIKWSDIGTSIAQAATAIVSAVAVIGAATDPSHKNTAQTTAGGALAGAKIGLNPALLAATGGLSALAIPIGALVGWWRGSHAEWKKVANDIGRDIGQDISDGLSQQIADMAKTLEGGTKQQRREMAELFSLDAIIAEAGGLKSQNVIKYEQQASKLFEVIQRGGENGAKATQELNTLMGEFGARAEKTGGMWDPVFKLLIAKSKELGINLEGVNAAVDAQIGKLSGGLAAAIKGSFAGADKQIEATKLTPEQIAAIRKAATVGVEGLDVTGLGITQKQIDAYKAAIGDAQGAFDRLSRTALASFNAIIASGKTSFQAMEQLGSSVDMLIAEHDKLGLAGGAAFDKLARFRNLTTQNADLVASVSGLNDVMVALSNLGGLNVETLADLEAQGLQAFQQLQDAGFTEAESLKQMEPLLRSIILAHEELGVPIDENTQKIIDQAKANGLLEDDTMSMVDVIKEGLGALIKGFGFDLPESFKKMAKAAKDASKDVADGINKIPKKVDIEVNYHPGDAKPEPPPLAPPTREPGDDGRRYDSGLVYNPYADPESPLYDPTYAPHGAHYATGGMVPEYAATGKTIGRLLNFKPRGTDTVPAMLTPGEGVLNTQAMRFVGSDGLAAMNSGFNPMDARVPAQALKTGTDGARNVYVDVTVAGDIIDSRERAVEVGKSIARQMRTNADLRDLWRTPIKGIAGSGL